MRLNPGLNCQLLSIGKQICIKSTPPIRSCGKYYTVKPGDYCFMIAQNNGISLIDFNNLNSGINCNSLKVGQTVCIAGGSGSLVTKDEFLKAVVSSGYKTPRDDQYVNFVSKAAPDGGFVYLSEIACLQNGCAGSYVTADDYPGQKYYGRGYIQLTWSYNYKAASQDLYNDLRLYTNANQVALDDGISWAVSFWYWKKKVHSRPGVSSGQFGATTNAINGALECSGPFTSKARQRFEIYKKVLVAFSIFEGPIENGCYN
ncbi:unnamed protein product [Brachionus calyciflorus]|uniref:LysM domain-containing protein n=1 Tax=Brachionus calyciflorus TaxID=104777 RepID=A0A814QQ18_9BILA|nr:unnamed protein product [Brachionus calyciflorus]